METHECFGCCLKIQKINLRRVLLCIQLFYLQVYLRPSDHIHPILNKNLNLVSAFQHLALAQFFTTLYSRVGIDGASSYIGRRGFKVNTPTQFSTTLRARVGIDVASRTAPMLFLLHPMFFHSVPILHQCTDVTTLRPLIIN